MMSCDLSAVANCVVFHSCIEVGRSSSSLHATALLILDSELVSAVVRYSLFCFDFSVDQSSARAENFRPGPARPGPAR